MKAAISFCSHGIHLLNTKYAATNDLTAFTNNEKPLGKKERAFSSYVVVSHRYRHTHSESTCIPHNDKRRMNSICSIRIKPRPLASFTVLFHLCLSLPYPKNIHPKVSLLLDAPQTG